MSRRKKRRTGPVRGRIELAAVLAFVWLVRLLPWPLASAAGAAIGGLFFQAASKRRRITLENLRRVFGMEKSEREIREIARACYRNLAVNAVEFARLGTMSAREIESRVRVRGEHHLIEAMDRGNGVIGFTSHLGNWELINLHHAIRTRPPYVVGRRRDNPWLDRWVNAQRERFGSRVIDSKDPGAIREILKALKSGESVAFLIDQSVSGDRGVFVDFFGKLAYTHKVVALIAERTDAAVIPVHVHRGEDGVNQITYEKPLAWRRSGDLERDVRLNTQQMSRIIEGWIREHPDQWLWMHDRWKKQPRDPAAIRADGAVFLDRDGTITEEIGYVRDLADFRLMKDSAEAIRLLNGNGVKTIVVTNQSGVARGYYDESQVQRVNRRLESLVTEQGARLDGVYYCPHHPTEGNGPLTFPCGCRKPEPGLLFRAEMDHGVRLSQSYVVGDKMTDIELARRVGATGILVLTGYGRGELERHRRAGGIEPDYVAEDLLSAVRWILERKSNGSKPATEPS
jgi:D-glycero-D-manno-heptose 1,7-bisphosphate phosphatase